MDSLLKKEHLFECILSALFVIYLIIGYNPPSFISEKADTLVGKLVILLIVIYFFMYKHPILAILSLFVAFDFIRKSSTQSGISALQKYAPSEEKKTSQFTAFNQFPYTLEQEVVKKMAPIINPSGSSSLMKPSFTPLHENIHDATIL
jgi:hypothetical protein